MLVAHMLPTQEIPKLPENTPPVIYGVVYGAIALIVVVGFLGRFLGARNKTDKPDPPVNKTDTSLPAARSGPVAEQAEASQALMERLVLGLEKRLDEALSTQRDIQRRYDEEVDELRAQLSTEQQAKWQLTSQMESLNRQLEDARTEVIRLRAELQVVRGTRGDPWS